MTLVTPAVPKSPVPVLMMFGRADTPLPTSHQPEEFARINTALKARWSNRIRRSKEVFAQHPAWQPVQAPPFRFRRRNEEVICPTHGSLSRPVGGLP